MTHVMTHRYLVLVLPLLLDASPVPPTTKMVEAKQALDLDDSVSVVTYNGQVGAAYDDSNYVKGSTDTYAVDEEGQAVAAHPSYGIQTPNGNLLLSGDSFGEGSGRGWANLFDDSAKLKWAWQSTHSEFDAVLGAAVLPDETVILGGARSVSKRYELLLAAIQSDGTEKWTTTFTLKSPTSSCTECWAAIYWVDIDRKKELLVVGGVVDHQGGAGTFAWKSGGGQPDAGGVPFLAAIPISKLDTAPTAADVQTAHYFDNTPGYTTVVSLRAEQGTGVAALLPLNPIGGAVARVTYDDSGNFNEEWVKPLTLQNQVTDIAIVGDSTKTSAYVVSATVNPGAKVEAVATDGSSAWVNSYDIKDIYPASESSKGKRNWCQECWSIATYGNDVMISCGVAELEAGDLNCDDGVWRSLLVNFNYQNPTNASYSLFHSNPDENFSVEYASFGSKGDVICTIDSDTGSSVVRVRSAA